MSSKCRACGADAATLIDFGPQPISNRFLERPEQDEYLFPVAMGQCGACGLVQLNSHPPASELRPRQDWITYNEPEPHLDALADRLASMLGPGSVACGVSFKDDSTLERLEKRGFAKSWRVTPEELGISEKGVGVETIQDRLGAKTAAALAGKHGAADVVIVRHILEHVFDLAPFLAAIRALGKPSALVVFEVPDCRRALETFDYSTVWEEHTIYFTAASLRSTLSRAGFAFAHYESVPYALENSLVAIVKNGAERPDLDLATELALGRGFASGLAAKAATLRRHLDGQRLAGPVALFGAGHLACTFVNLLGLKDRIAFVADDHPNKKGLFMPGSRLPIRGSGALLEDKVKLCLLSLHPDSEDKVIARNQAFAESGGVFRSIFPASRRALTP